MTAEHKGVVYPGDPEYEARMAEAIRLYKNWLSRKAERRQKKTDTPVQPKEVDEAPSE